MRPILIFFATTLASRHSCTRDLTQPVVFRRSVVHHAEHTLATDRYNFDDGTAYQAVALSVRDHLVESLRDTKAHYLKEDPKRVYYLSLEFLMGRSLLNSLMNLDLEKPYKEALEEIGYKLEVPPGRTPPPPRHPATNSPIPSPDTSRFSLQLFYTSPANPSSPPL